MTSTETVRQTVIAAFKAVHEANYSSTPVNYPNYVVVDLEHQALPFVSVEFSIDESDRAALGERDIFVQGTLRVYYYFRDGGGLDGAYSYTDMLNEYLGMTQADSISYRAVQTLNISSFPGWQGVMNAIKFDVVAVPSC